MTNGNPRHVTITPEDYNASRGNFSISMYQVKRLLNGEFDKFTIEDKVNNSKINFGAQALIEYLRGQKPQKRFFGGEYFVVPWMEVINLQVSKSRVVDQKTVAEIYGVSAPRICELHRFGKLQPIHPNKRPLLYKLSDVHALLEDPQVVGWINRTKQAEA